MVLRGLGAVAAQRVWVLGLRYVSVCCAGAVAQGEVVRVGADQRSVAVLLPAEQDVAGNTRNTMKKFELDGCLDPGTSQEQAFEHSGVKDLLNAALDVRNAGRPPYR